MVVQNYPLMLPLLRLAVISQQAEQFCNYPSAENVSSVERVEGYVRVGVAWLVIWSEHHPVRVACSSRVRLARVKAHLRTEFCNALDKTSEGLPALIIKAHENIDAEPRRKASETYGGCEGISQAKMD